MARPAMLVYSPARWHAYGRHQHVISGLVDGRRLVVVESPLGNADSEAWETVEQRKNLSVFRPRLRGAVDGFEPATHDRLAPLLESLVAVEGIGRHTAWLSTPLAYPPARALAPEVIVYDCTDEPSPDPAAPQPGADIEARLLRHADLVLTSGPSLHAAKKDRHPNVHCVPASVDAGHFRRGRAERVAADYADIPPPRLGFHGILDARVDWPLVAGLAFAHPEWQVVLLGPIRDVEPGSLPQAPNLSYLGERSDADLPSHLAAWDAVVLPFATGPATRFLSPTQPLEAMAAGRPIVTTAIPDVVGPYEDMVFVGEGADGLARACAHALAERGNARASRLERMRSVVDHTSWSHAVKRIDEQLRHVESRFVHYGQTLELTLGSLLRTRDA